MYARDWWSLEHIVDVSPQISLKNLLTMMSDQDCKLLVELTPKLMDLVIIEDSNLLAQLRAKDALTAQQKEAIKVTEQ